MNNFVVIEVKIIMLIKWSYMPLHTLLTMDFRIVNIVWTYNPDYF